MTETVFEQMKKPIGAIPGTQEWEKAAKSWMSLMPADMQAAGNLMAPAMATAAAMSAVGVAAAAQTVGLFMGAMNGMAEATRMMRAETGAPFGWGGADEAPKPAVKAKAKPESAKTARKKSPATHADTAAADMAPAPQPELLPTDPVEAITAARLAADTIAEDFSRAVEDTIEVTEKAIAGIAEDMGAMAKSATAATSEAVAAVMPEDFVKPAGVEKPQQPDDLKLISGVGPKLEQVLNGLGIWTFAQIEKWSEREIAWVDDYLQFSGRIGRDNWIGQAAALAKGGIEEYRRVFGKEPK
jgi:NADH-quinone oxidoreductase subunit E